jgi:hypothetical protein
MGSNNYFVGLPINFSVKEEDNKHIFVCKIDKKIDESLNEIFTDLDHINLLRCFEIK